MEQLLTEIETLKHSMQTLQAKAQEHEEHVHCQGAISGHTGNC